ncbi:LURP1-like domain-containing protein [Artemisia annua]|uniref:LURP1-like domain-containing protein n=1 Tax=Artemisia annua TaxID=35608 RepID=A0A2U1L7Q1_ARTAN|nr:LURP1-like domain-containing protein [Artemisia annua]
MAQPVYVIGSQFMAPYPFDLIVDLNSGGNLVITDMNHKVLLKVKSCNTTFHHGRMLLHADGTPIVRVREKILSKHNRWKVFKGDSTSSSNMLFSTKQPSIIQFKTSLNVFLANKMNGKDDCDFKIKGSWSKKKCTIYMGDSHSSTIIAQMRKMQKSKKDKFDKDKFVVTISPNVDYAFVITLIAIVDAMKNLDKEYAEQISTSTSQVIGATAS